MMKFICLKYSTEESTASRLHTVQVNNEKNVRDQTKLVLQKKTDLLPSGK